ncbi:MAG: hypothetical protein ACREMC_07650 [Gemmatimonadales bacterium]
MIRRVAGAAGFLALLALQPGPATAGDGAPVLEALVLSEQARRYLVLQYRAFNTEFLGCMIGELRGSTVVVRRIAPADVDPSQSTSTQVVPKQTCERSGWSGTVGMIHSHPSGERCWYYFPGTHVPSSDGQSFLRSPYPVDAIMCGDRVVWIRRELAEEEIPLVEQPRDVAVAAPAAIRGNLTQQGLAAP